jgi:hypothetical protein
MQPQLALPDRIADLKYEFVPIDVGQAAVLGQRNGQVLAQDAVEPVQPTGPFDQA